MTHFPFYNYEPKDSSRADWENGNMVVVMTGVVAAFIVCFLVFREGLPDSTVHNPRMKLKLVVIGGGGGVFSSQSSGGIYIYMLPDSDSENFLRASSIMSSSSMMRCSFNSM